LRRRSFAATPIESCNGYAMGAGAETRRKMKAVESAFRRLYDIFALIGVAVVGLMVVVICVDVVLRNATNAGIEASNEISEYCLYAITLMTAPWLLSQNQHIRIDALVAVVPYPVAWALEFIADVIGFLVGCVLVWYGAQVTLTSFAAHSLVIKSMIFPEWWLFAPLPVAMFLLAVEFALRAIRLITGERRAGATTANIT